MRRCIVLVLALMIAACSPSEDSAELAPTTTAAAPTTTSNPPDSATTTTATDFAITSPAFGEGEAIPVEHTCDGADFSPELLIEGVPVGTQALVIIVNDPDAPLGNWDHWVEFDIPAASGQVVIPRDTPPLGIEAVNSWNLGGYMGPCPPPGEEHGYVFTVYAIDELLDLPSGVDSDAIRTAMDGRVIDSVELTGVYGR